MSTRPDKAAEVDFNRTGIGVCALGARLPFPGFDLVVLEEGKTRNT